MRMMLWFLLLGMSCLPVAGQTPRRPLPAPTLPDRTPVTPAVPLPTAEGEMPDPIVRELRELVKVVAALTAQTRIQAANVLIDASLKRQATLESQIETLQAEYDRLRAEQAANLARLQDLSGELSRMAYVSQAEAEARIRADVAARDAAVQPRLTSLETRLNEKRAELVQVTAELELLKGRLRSVLDDVPTAAHP